MVKKSRKVVGNIFRNLSNLSKKRKNTYQTKMSWISFVRFSKSFFSMIIVNQEIYCPMNCLLQLQTTIRCSIQGLFGFYKRMRRDGDGVIPPVVHEQKVIFQGIDYHIRMTSRIIRRKIIKCWRQCWIQGY